MDSNTPPEGDEVEDKELDIEFEEGESAVLSYEDINARLTVSPVEPPALEDWDFAVPSEETQLYIQEALHARGFYDGKQNGSWGPLTIFGIRQAVAPLATNGSAKPKDPRTPDRELCELVHEYATLLGNYSLAITSSTTILNEDVWIAFLKGLEAEEK